MTHGLFVRAAHWWSVMPIVDWWPFESHIIIDSNQGRTSCLDESASWAAEEQADDAMVTLWGHHSPNLIVWSIPEGGWFHLQGLLIWSPVNLLPHLTRALFVPLAKMWMHFTNLFKCNSNTVIVSILKCQWACPLNTAKPRPAQLSTKLHFHILEKWMPFCPTSL